jgi:5'(3')-deoxyribonucleotidase
MEEITMRKKVYYFDMDGVLANFHKEPYSYAKAINREWIANLEPFEDAIATVKRLMSEGKSIYINSLAASEDAKQGKIDWLNKYLPEIPKSHIIIIVGSGKKSDYMKTKTGTLVDDKASNCKQWTKMSGQPHIWVEQRGVVII